MAERYDPGDPLEELRAAWRSVETPAAGGALEDADARTRATVEWLRAAWRDAAPERSVPPVLTGLAGRSAPRARPLPLAYAAAAAVCVALGAALWFALAKNERAAAPVPAPVAELVPPLPVAEPTLAALEPDRIEMRAGNVRLILLTDN